jgi:hypothetical protein
MLICACQRFLLNQQPYILTQPPRYGLDTWEEMMMERDRRLTGSARGQSVRPATIHLLLT